MEAYLGDHIHAPDMVSRGRHFQGVARLLASCKLGVVRSRLQTHPEQEVAVHQIGFLGLLVRPRPCVEDRVADCQILMPQTACDL